jgi:uncharacterized protein (DUF302 family)
MTTSFPSIVTHASPFSVAETISRLEQAFAARGMTVFAKIDHAAGARQVGMEMPPATVLIYGHPKGGTPAMLAAPLAALDLPLRVLVHQRADGGTEIAYHPVAAMLAGAGVPQAVAAALEPAQNLLAAALAAPPRE